MGRRRFSVLIPYKEPAFKDTDHVYDGTIEVEALNERQAKQLAVARFRELAAASNVHWKREIVVEGIRVEAVDEARA